MFEVPLLLLMISPSDRAYSRFSARRRITWKQQANQDRNYRVHNEAAVHSIDLVVPQFAQFVAGLAHEPSPSGQRNGRASIAGAATLAQRRRRSCKGVHWR